ncbi:MAG: non-canonical purine NTP pyrophosphatase, RdgB/HAM1 family [Micavibrio sp.]|nr:non-canonical purine NTP pyrophosphatase, RdgB/HAM1 family [Micavibrio sp.]|tara:strand:- start:1280 stop:1882 length:603 start_codon:yes stop_codon:yes gene_type:complete
MIDLNDEDLVIASHNQGKVREIAELLKPYVSRFYSASDLDLAEPEETGKTFIANALLKARAAAEASGKVALADDSGLSVCALNGDPGIYSARWAGEPRDFNVAMERVHNELGDSADRSAAFMCVLALAWPNGDAQTFEGRIDGEIVWPPRGERGFGYDPIFVAKGMQRTFAEIDPQDKHRISHRANAFQKLEMNLVHLRK